MVKNKNFKFLLNGYKIWIKQIFQFFIDQGYENVFNYYFYYVIIEKLFINFN